METTVQETAEDTNLQDIGEGEKDPILNAGEFEGLQKPKKGKGENHPPEGSPRWNEIYFKAKEFERTKEETETLKKEYSELKGSVDEMRRHNEMLAQSLNQTKPEVKDTLDEQIERLQSEMDTANDEGDMKKASRLLVQINGLNTRKIISGLNIPKTDEIVEKVKTTVSGDNIKNVYSEWKKGNTWYKESPSNDNDFILKTAAESLTQKYLGEGLAYNEALNKMTEEVNRLYLKNKSGVQFSSVEGSSNNVKTSTGKKWTTENLTEEHKKVAKMFGMSLQDKAKQLNQIGGM